MLLSNFCIHSLYPENSLNYPLNYVNLARETVSLSNRDNMKPSEKLIKKIEEELARRDEPPGSIDELNEIARQVTQEYNDSPHPDFEGLSPSQMFYIVNQPQSEKIIAIRENIDPEIVSELPLVRAASIIIGHIDPDKGLKLTATGKLPRKVVTEIHSEGKFKPEYERLRPPKVMNEDDFLPAGMGHILLRLAGFVRISKNIMIITRKGKKAMQDPVELFSGLYRVFAYKFNKGWFDRYESEEIGNVGLSYVIFLLSRYGGEMRNADFYAEKYFRAFPFLRTLTDRFPGPNESCFEVRVFSRGLYLFGLTDRMVTKSDGFGRDYHYSRSKAFNKIFTVNNSP